jgi:hypothetical protein
VVRQVGLGIMCPYKVGFGERFFSRRQTIPRLILTLFLVLTCRVHDKMEYRRRRYFLFPTHPSRYSHLLSISIPSFGFGVPCAELPTDPAMRFADLFLTRESLEGRTHQAVSVGHRSRHERR